MTSETFRASYPEKDKAQEFSGMRKAIEVYTPGKCDMMTPPLLIPPTACQSSEILVTHLFGWTVELFLQ